MAASGGAASGAMPSFVRVLIDGKQHTELGAEVVLHEVEVNQELNTHWWAQVLLRQTDDERFPIEDYLGKDMQVIAVDQMGQEHILFQGFVLEAEMEYEVYGCYTARFQGASRTYRLDQSTRHAYFRKKSMEEIANEVVSDDGLEVAITDIEQHGWDPARPMNYVQWGESDFAFLNRLADDNWAWTRPTENGIEICGAFQNETILEWRREDGLTKFSIRGKLGQPAFSGAYYNVRTAEAELMIDQRREASFFDGSREMSDAVKAESPLNLTAGSLYAESRAPSPDEYQQLLEKESVRAIGGKLLGKGSSRFPALKPGGKRKIEGFVPAAGVYGLTRVVHFWNQRGYHNDFECTPWRTYFNPVAPKVPKVAGVVPALVIDHNDPRSLGRIKVQYYWDDGDDTAWARMVAPHAGPGRGFVFRPEVGDEVLVAFELGDPERPYILGCLFNGVNQPPREGIRDTTEQEHGGATNADLAANNVKRIFTKSGVGMQFGDEDGDEMLTMVVPGGLTFYMQRKNEKTNRPMIYLLQKDGDIVLDAPKGRIHMRSKYFSKETG